MSLSTVVINWTEIDIAQAGLSGVISFTLSQFLTDTAGGETCEATRRAYPFTSSTGTSDPLAANDSASAVPSGTYYTVEVNIAGLPSRSFTAPIDIANGASQTLAFLQSQAVIPSLPMSSYLETTGGTMAGPLILDGGLTIDGVPVGNPPGGTADYLRADGTWNVPAGGGGGISPPAGDIGGTAGSPTVVSTHLSAALPVAQGGTAATSAAAALTSLGAAAASALTAETGRAETAEELLAPKASPALTGTPTAPTAAALTDDTQLATTAYADAAVAVETGRAGTAEGLLAPKASPVFTGTVTVPDATTSGEAAAFGQTPAGGATVTIAEGGTGQASAQSAMNALAGALTSGEFLRGNGVNVQMSAIQAADVPTLNQPTTGNAATATTAGNVTGIVAVANGGTGVNAASDAALLAGLGAAALAGAAFTGSVTSTGDIQATSYIQGNRVTSSGFNGLGSTRLVGSTASGAPSVAAPFNVSDFAVDDTGTVWVCTTAGSPGTWTQAGSALAAAAQASAEAASVPLSDLPVSIASGGTGQTAKAAAFNALTPIAALGDLEYGSAANTASRLAGNITAVRQYLQQTGTGTVSAAPGWGTISPADLPWTATPAANQLGPADHGLIAWNISPYNLRSSDTTSLTAGDLFVMKVPVPYATTISKVGISLPSLWATGDATTGENYLGLWGPTGTLLSLTADMSALFAGTGAAFNALAALATAEAVSAGYVYVGVWVNGTGTAPTIERADAPQLLACFGLASTTPGASSVNYGIAATGLAGAATAGNISVLNAAAIPGNGPAFACVA